MATHSQVFHLFLLVLLSGYRLTPVHECSHNSVTSVTIEKIGLLIIKRLGLVDV